MKYHEGEHQDNAPPKRNWRLGVRRTAGGVMLAGGLFCGLETYNHFDNALDLQATIDAAQSHSHPHEVPDQRDNNLAYQNNLFTIKTGEENGYRIYGIGFLALASMGAVVLANNPPTEATVKS